MDAQKIYQAWLHHPDLLEADRKELLDLAGKTEEVEDRFYQELAFGTAGLRGIMGTGTNRMNVYNVARAAEAYARYLLAYDPEVRDKGIAISYDSRLNSEHFARIAAAAFVNHDIKVLFSDELRPVSYLAFAVRHYLCAGGIMITASHNPKQYNGFKVFGPNGAQLPVEVSDLVAAEIARIADPIACYHAFPEWDSLTRNDNLRFLGQDLDAAYENMALELSPHPEAIRLAQDFKLVYTPLNGTGRKPVCRLLKGLGLKQFYLVEKQAMPDGNFPTTPYPNPEDPKALTLALELMEQEKADMVLATDPDADRLGVVVRDLEGKPYLLSGNETGLLLLDYILSEKKLAQRPFAVTTIVSSRLVEPLAKSHGVEVFRTLTGFKNMARVIEKEADHRGRDFCFAYEESFGYLCTPNIRDKDAVSAAMLMTEMACLAKRQGESCYQRLEHIYQRFGYTAEKTWSFVREGQAGQATIKRAMTTIRAAGQEAFPELKLRSISDYEQLLRLNLLTGEQEELAEERSNVLVYELEGLDWFACRPSGTEPKLKLYLGVTRHSKAEAQAALSELESKVREQIEKALAE
ncbi:MAG: phospho-sugar mutase [Eubacteriales bacterium]|nr:phospho-sugar mutase [Eubacteriales bacterium]